MGIMEKKMETTRVYSGYVEFRVSSKMGCSLKIIRLRLRF